MSRYHDKLQIGDRMTFTDAVAQDFESRGVHHQFEYGDDMIVLGIMPEKKFPVLVCDPQDITWRGWLIMSVARDARSFWLRQQELLHENEGVSTLLPLAYWHSEYASLSPAEQSARWQEQSQREDVETLWRLLVDRPQNDS